MEKLFANRALALCAIMALAMVAFGGFIAMGEEDLPDPFTVTVTDDYETATDSMGYVGTVFNFTFTDDLGIGDNATWFANLTYKLFVDDVFYMDFEYIIDGAGNYWAVEWTAAEAGTFNWEANITDENFGDNFVAATGMLTVYAMPAWTGTSEDLSTLEDTPLELNLSMEFSGEGITFAEEAAPVHLTITKADNWTFTPEADWNGYELVNITATDINGESVYNIYNITVDGTNDAPMIEYLMIEGVQVDYELWNYTWVDETDGNMSEFRNVFNLTFDEEGNVSFMAYATDIDMDVLEYTLDMGDAPVAVDNLDVNETNVTIPFNFTITGDEDANGVFWGTMNITDGTIWDIMYIQLTIEAVNDAPTATGDWDATYDIKTEEGINVSASGTDVDGDDLTFIWKIDGTTVVEMEYFAYNWTEAGTYNVSVEVSDGTDTIDIGYFTVNVEVANTAPSITLVTAYPVGLGILDQVDFILKGEVEEGADVDLSCIAYDAEGDTLTYTWTNDQDSAWTMNGTDVVVPTADLQKGLSYIFTCTVSDGVADPVTMPTSVIKIVEKDDDPSFLEACGLMILIPILIFIVIVVIIVIIIKKKGKKDEEVPEETPMEEEMPIEEPGMEGEMPMEGMEQPIPEELPVEQPVEVPVEEPVAPAPEEPVAPVEEPVAPAPEEPVAPVEGPAAPEQPPAPPMPPQ